MGADCKSVGLAFEGSNPSPATTEGPSHGTVLRHVRRYRSSVTRTTRLVELTENVWVATSRRYATNSTVLMDGHGGAVVIDPAWDPDELAAIPEDLAALGVRCVGGVSTHEHYDHVLWHPDLGDVPRWACRETVAMVSARERSWPPHRRLARTSSTSRVGCSLCPDGTALDRPDGRIQVHDAHAPGHLAVLVEASGSSSAGDMLSDVELPMPAEEDATSSTYAAGLESLRDAVGTARLLVPGHGTPRDDHGTVRRGHALPRRPAGGPSIGRSAGRHPDNARLHDANLRRAGGGWPQGPADGCC